MRGYGERSVTSVKVNGACATVAAEEVLDSLLIVLSTVNTQQIHIISSWETPSPMLLNSLPLIRLNVKFRKYFNMFDKENKGYIKATQVGQILRTMGQAFEERDLKQLIKEFDTDGSGEIEFEEFAAMVANFVVNSEDNEGLEEELREAFRFTNKSLHLQGNGYINVSDLRDILRALDENVSEEELDEMIAEIDTDGSGTVDFDEFMEMMSGE
ncbi:EF hand [Ostertagia ostertagi]